VALAAILIGEVAYLLEHGVMAVPAASVVIPRAVGIALYGPYLIGVELSSMLLMAALVGAYHLGWHKQPKLEIQDVNREYGTGTDAGRDSIRPGSGRPAGAA
jgi:NADH-quinone oxidoreductase subunit J